MSSKKTITNFFWKDSNNWFIVGWKVLSPLVKPSGITKNSYWPSWRLVKCYLWYVSFMHSDLMITRMEVYLEKSLEPNNSWRCLSTGDMRNLPLIIYGSMIDTKKYHPSYLTKNNRWKDTGALSYYPWLHHFTNRNLNCLPQKIRIAIRSHIYRISTP